MSEFKQTFSNETITRRQQELESSLRSEPGPTNAVLVNEAKMVYEDLQRACAYIEVLKTELADLNERHDCLYINYNDGSKKMGELLDKIDELKALKTIADMIIGMIVPPNTLEGDLMREYLQTAKGLDV